MPAAGSRSVAVAVTGAGLLALYLVSRLLFLDADLPHWLVSYYAPIDEFYYTLTAFNVVEGVHAPEGGRILEQFWFFNILQQLVTILGLLLAGDTYLGLRGPSVLAGLVVAGCFHWLVLKRFGVAVATAFSLLLIAECSFLLATRTAEPTIFRLAAASLLLVYCVRKERIGCGDALRIGVFSALAWLLVYPTNAFLGLFGLLVVGFTPGEPWRRRILYYFIGAALVGIAYLLAFDPIPAYLDVEEALGDRIAGTSETVSFRVLAWSNIYYVHSANLFKFNPPLLLLAATSTVFLLASALLRMPYLRRSDYLVLAMLLVFALQTVFVNDYPERKLVAMVPLVLYAGVLPFALMMQWLASGRFALRPVARYLAGAAVLGVLLATLARPTYAVVYRAPEYTYRDAMLSLRELGDARTVGGWGLAFRLYNDLRPYLNRYRPEFLTDSRHYLAALQEAGRRGDAIHIIDYADVNLIYNLATVGFFAERVILFSRDPVYPDVMLYTYQPQRVFDTRDHTPTPSR